MNWTNSGGRRAFVYSVILHGLFLAALALGGLWDLVRRPTDFHVFTLVKAESRALEAMESPLREVAPKPSRREVPEREHVERISFEEFLATHGEPKIARPRSRATPMVVYEEIDIDKIESNLANILDESASETVSGAHEQWAETGLKGYVERLRRGINLAWKKPPSLRGRLFHTTVRFSIDSRGEIEDVRIAESSGNEIFDESVTEAFTRFVSIGPPPDDRGYRLKLTFRMVE